MSEGRFEIRWVRRGGPPQQPPDPRYPDGVDVDISLGAARSCSTPLPYPVDRNEVGTWLVECQVCGLRVGITAASRPDDPRSVKIACKLPGRTQ